MLKYIYKLLHPKYQKLFMEYPVEFKPRYGHGNPPHKQLYDIINRNREIYKDYLTDTLQYKNKLWEIKESKNETDPNKPRWNNNYLPGLDIVAIYSLLARFKPSLYLEIGSGNSTKVAYKSKIDNNLDTKIISIDPAPRAEIDSLSDQIIRKPLEQVDLSVLDQLKENDFLFLDGSHRILPNSDTTVFFLEILPKIKKGVIVQIHDICLPFDYPQDMCDRFYSEQYALAVLLLANPDKYEIIMPNYFIAQDNELKSAVEPLWNSPHLSSVERHGASFWFIIK
jgi:hypothetical protein